MEKDKTFVEGVHYATGRVIRLGISGGRIFSVTETGEYTGLLAGGTGRPPVIAPGLVDLQVNGYRGTDFNDGALTPEQVEHLSRELLRTGVTRYFPTLITGPAERTIRNLRVIAEACGSGMAAALIGGIHLEGPFISPEDGPRGAHPSQYCTDPDPRLLEQWQTASGWRIRILTLAPELPGSMELIQACTETGIIAAIGHTAAGSDDIRRAADAGARLSTHLGNGCHRVLPRHPNCIWDQLAEDRLHASFIADGIHLYDSVLRVFIRVKGKKAILVSDSMPYAGMAPGLYDSPATGKVRLTEEGRLHREGDPERLAGSAVILLDGVRRAAELEGFPVAWDMASVHPAALLDPGSPRGLQVGAPADLVLLDRPGEEARIIKVFRAGKEYRVT
jgi:N-acetylglucosamine-6-phosphate deacetylase